MIIFLCPGQGSQTPGFLNPWLEDADIRTLIEGYSASSGVDLITHGTKSDADTIRDTAIAQPLIVSASLASFHALGKLVDLGQIEYGTVGHSVGEFAAAAISGVLSDNDAVALVRKRSLAMADAAAQEATSMAAILGGDEALVLEKLQEHAIQAANFNGGGQIVAAGSLAAIAALKDDPPQGSRVIPLQVAGAFHTSYMQPAVARLEAAAAQITPDDPKVALWTNHDGSRVSSGQAFIDLLVGQIASPVRWDRNMAALAELPIKGLIELSPAGTLVGLARRGLPGVPAVALKTPEDLVKAVEMIQA
ncbi:MAG: ACP S-malonyltransferase [Microbacteriaceae bacterium]